MTWLATRRNDSHLTSPRSTGILRSVSESANEASQDPALRPTWAAQVPPWLNNPRLELILGCALAAINWSVVSSLVERRVTEDLTLDYKRELYGRSDADKKELAKDVAALANAAGGLIILGVDEDAQSAARGVPCVALSDDERRRMVDILVRGIAPLVPDLVVGEVEHPEDSARGVYMLLVPPSDQAPHGVRRNDAYAWPVREDRQARWMSESELASRYRTRFSGESQQTVRLDKIWQDSLPRVVSRHRGYVAVGLVPGRAGHLPADRAAYSNWLRSTNTPITEAVGDPEGTVSLGRRRVVFGGSSDHHVELHSDGSGFAAGRVTVDRSNGLELEDAPSNSGFVALDLLATWSVGIANLLALHAANAGSSGDLAMRWRLVGPAHCVNFLIERTLLGRDRAVPGSRHLGAADELDATASMSIVTSPRDLLDFTESVLGDLVAEFNVAPPAVRLLTDDGRACGFPGPRAEHLRAWLGRSAIIQ